MPCMLGDSEFSRKSFSRSITILLDLLNFVFFSQTLSFSRLFCGVRYYLCSILVYFVENRRGVFDTKFVPLTFFVTVERVSVFK